VKISQRLVEAVLGVVRTAWRARRSAAVRSAAASARTASESVAGTSGAGVVDVVDGPGLAVGDVDGVRACPRSAST
jgi:hypothetical protein